MHLLPFNLCDIYFDTRKYQSVCQIQLGIELGFVFCEIVA